MGSVHSHQTVRLSAGRHRGPADGVCVMELAAMLAGEPFSDRPESVCPVLAGFLRSYNDHVDDESRQDLYRYAALVVGTRGDEGTERRRAQACLQWAREACRTPPWRVRILHRLLRCQGPDVDGVYAARAAVATPGAHRLALAFLDGLIGAGCDCDRSDMDGWSGARARDAVMTPRQTGAPGGWMRSGTGPG